MKRNMTTPEEDFFVNRSAYVFRIKKAKEEMEDLWTFHTLTRFTFWFLFTLLLGGGLLYGIYQLYDAIKTAANSPEFATWATFSLCAAVVMVLTSWATNRTILTGAPKDSGCTNSEHDSTP